MPIKQIVLILALVLAWGPLQAKNLYVSTTGSDSTTYAANDISHPWLTVQKAFYNAQAVTNNSTQSAGISDDFSSNTASSYTAIGGGISITGGAAHGSSGWDVNSFYHNTECSSSDNYGQADISFHENDRSFVSCRVGTTTGYAALILGGSVYLASFSGTTFSSPIAAYNGSYAEDTAYTVKVSASGTTIKVFVGGTERISVTDSTYSTGTHAGFGMNRGFVNYDLTVDNFSAE